MIGCSWPGIGCIAARSEFWGPVCTLSPGSVRAVPCCWPSDASCPDDAASSVPSVTSDVSVEASIAAVSAAWASAMRAESSAVGS
jgi:hypothetical protein